MVEAAIARAQSAPFVAVPAARAASFLAEDKMISAALGVRCARIEGAGRRHLLR